MNTLLTEHDIQGYLSSMKDNAKEFILFLDRDYQTVGRKYCSIATVMRHDYPELITWMFSCAIRKGKDINGYALTRAGEQVQKAILAERI